MASNNLHKLAQGSDAPGIRHKPSKPWESILTPYLGAIAEMRSGRHPIPYRKIALILKEKYGIEIAFSTVASFFRARAKERWQKKIHLSFFQKKFTSTAGMVEDPIEMLRRKRIDPRPQVDSWKSLDVQGPLIRELPQAPAKGKGATIE